MQITFDIAIIGIAVSLIGALSGGVAARYCIWALDANERVREGSLNAYSGLRLAEELVRRVQSHFEISSSMQPTKYNVTRLDQIRMECIQLIIKGAAKGEQSDRHDLLAFSVDLEMHCVPGEALDFESYNRLTERSRELAERIYNRYKR